jgi:hypothetical protein
MGLVPGTVLGMTAKLSHVGADADVLACRLRLPTDCG